VPKSLAYRSDRKIILLEYQNNYIERLNIFDNKNVKCFNICRKFN